MNRLSILSVSAALALGLATLASAGTATGTTKILGAAAPDAVTDTPTDVEISITTTAPVVPYEYSLINKCWFSGKTSGPSDSFERFDLAGPWFLEPPTMIVSVNVQPVPEGSRCKVYLIKNNTVVKGSTTSYSVVP